MGKVNIDLAKFLSLHGAVSVTQEWHNAEAARERPPKPENRAVAPKTLKEYIKARSHVC